MLTLVLGLSLGGLPLSTSFDLLESFHVLFELVRLAGGVGFLVIGGGLFFGRCFSVRGVGRGGGVKGQEMWHGEKGSGESDEILTFLSG